MTEDTKPVEREAFDEWFDANYYTVDPIAKRTICASWDAALERAAQATRCYKCEAEILALKGRK